MAMSTSLTIKEISKNEKQYSFDCIGSIDAHADQPLEVLRKLPGKIKVILDFGHVERVNSMGLSLLLRLFEDWEKDSTEIEIRNLNRMVSMLFKITGLGRFIQSGKSGIDPSGRKLIEPKPPTQTQPHIEEQTTLQANGKLNFVASLQSGHQLSGWYLFNTYLQRKMQRAIHFEQLQDIQNEEFHLFFAKPFDACSLMQKKGFIPLVRPDCDADEVIILCRADDNRNLSDFIAQKPKVVTADQGSFVYLLGRFLCDESGLDSSGFSYQFSGNEIKSLQMLIRKKAEIAFILKKTFQGLSSFSRNNVRQLDESSTDFAFHQFCIAPNLKDQGDTVCEILMAMEQDEKGKQILDDIQFNGWLKPEAGEIKMLQMVFDRYAN
jgi:anti-anti-sigma factor